jgi:hypothetical protein
MLEELIFNPLYTIQIIIQVNKSKRITIVLPLLFLFNKENVKYEK